MQSRRLIFRKGVLSRLCLVVSLLIIGLPSQAGAADQAAYPWVYLRDGELPAASEHLVEVIAVGDVMPGRGLDGRHGIFDHVAAELGGADLAIGNLEGVMAVDPTVMITPSLFIPPRAAVSLVEAGFDLLSQANNHSLDAGPSGLVETARRLQEAGVQPIQSSSPLVRETRGLKIAFLAWNEITPADSHQSKETGLLQTLRAVRRSADVVIVLVHWGQEYQRHPSFAQRRLAVELLQAGADVILGSHPHVVQDLAMVKSENPESRPQLVAYSLGNFVFDQGWDDTTQGLALRLSFDRQGLRAAQVLPLWTAPRPRWMAPGEAAALLERILPAKRSGYGCDSQGCRMVDVPQEHRSGLFFSGLVDMAGDGNPELVSRQAQSVTIYQDGEPVWRSPPEWRVLDLAAGDPNNDGRYELLLAIEKPDGAGKLASQPFILGYRGGLYRLLWGGSPVSDPILEVELGDVNGDGVQELLAIESPAIASTDPGNQRFVTIWGWHGWGFSLIWRSPPGTYQDLALISSGTGRPLTISVGQRSYAEK